MNMETYFINFLGCFDGTVAFDSIQNRVEFLFFVS